MHSFLQDARFSLRLIRRHPAMSSLVLAALALGIGVNSAVFSVVNSVLLRPVPLVDAERVAFIWDKSPQSSSITVSYPEFEDWRAQSHSFQGMAACTYLSFNLKADGHPEHLLGIGASASIFAILGISPAIGRDFTEADDRPGAPRVVVISHGLWQRRFGADPGIIGKTVVLDSQPYTIIGVLPANDFPLLRFDFWVGIGPLLDQHMLNRETRYFWVVGRLAPSARLAQAQEEMNIIAGRLAAQYPKSNKDMSTTLDGLVETYTEDDRKPLWLIGTASALLLLLATVNVVTVFITGAIERRKELSVRLALGASRSTIWRQLFVQSLIFAVVGASLGLVLAKVGLTYLMQKFPMAVFRFRETMIDQTVLWFTICLALGSTLLSSLLPGLFTAKLNLTTELKGEWSGTIWSKYRSLGQGALIVFEVSLAAGLSLVSGLLIKTFYELNHVNMEFDPHHLACFFVSLPKTEYNNDAAKVAFYRQATENLKAIPGVQSATGGLTLPVVTGTHFINLQVDAQSPHSTERPFVDSDSVLPGFLTTLKTPFVQGRDFTAADDANAPPVAIVDELLAAHIWPGQSAIGKRLRLADITDDQPPWREIVGVVPQIKVFGPEGTVEHFQVYEPEYQHPSPGGWFLLDTQLSLASLRPSAEEAIHRVAPDLPLDNLMTVDDSLDQLKSGRKVSLLLLSGFAAVGISLGMIGVYGVVSSSVARRQREVAIRMALGASPRSSIVLVTKLGLLATVAGIGLGSILVVCLTRILSAFLFGVTVLDPGIYLFTAVAIAVLAVIASVVPAVSLLRLSPQDVLRER